MKTKKRAGKEKRAKRQKSIRNLALEEHLASIIQRLEGEKTQLNLEKVVKSASLNKSANRERKKSVSKAIKTKAKQEFYKRHHISDSNYTPLEKFGIYSQFIISPFAGFAYKSNIKENYEFYSHLRAQDEAINTPLSERAIVSGQMMDDYARKFTLNFLFGADMNDISIKEKELMLFSMYDPTQKLLYLAKLSFLGFGTEKMLHAPARDNSLM